ncbi:MAG: DUF2752 domain-containing protein [Muribaculaceae bacterium]|nr:DUF2752 domain-containing protein [Muribaculaceae bacterium]
MTSRHKILLLAIAGAVVTCIYFYFDPSDNYFPRCPFLMLTGYQCPGCGTQRAIHALLHGDIANAWHFNAAFMCSLPIIALLAVAELTRKRWPRYHMMVNSKYAVWTIFIAIVGWWFGRNIL